MATINKEKSKEIKLLAARIKQLRQDKGYTSQETFAYDHGYTLSYYSRLERGEDIRFSSLVKVCVALNVSLDEFFNGFEELKPIKKKKSK
jgi:transcriptional regulator with XRE-family HTH domain